LGIDGGEAKFYVYIQSTAMERPDLERTMEQVLDLLYLAITILVY
jgi:hypothetical protein